MAMGLLGEGILSTVPSIGAAIRMALPHGWPARSFWSVALDLDRGERVVFGAPGAPPVDLHVAISASTSVPGVFAPVLVDGRRYGDAGLISPSNLDLVAGMGFDAVVCINPMSGGDEPIWRKAFAANTHPLAHAVKRAAAHAFAQTGSRLRRHFDGLLARERALVEATGTRVFVLHPSAEDQAHFPLNSMGQRARSAIVSRARHTTATRLRTDPALRPLAELFAKTRVEDGSSLKIPA